VSQRTARILADLRRRTDAFKRRGDQLERRNDELGRRTETVRQDWRRKRADSGVPGAVPEEREGPGADSPEGRDRGKPEGPGADGPEEQDRGSEGADGPES
jgi:hypothetical protein